ncbi:MAG: mechanosensitive ion channel [Chitinophagales bacterium]|nr:mechanosensitive ion channel [Chitinophagales bacterium]
MSDFFNQELFTLGEHMILVQNIVILALLLLVLGVGFWLVALRLLPQYFKKEKIDAQDKRRMQLIIAACFVLLAVLAATLALNYDPELLSHTIGKEDNSKRIILRLSTLVNAFLAILVAQLLDIFISKIVLNNYYQRRQQESIELDEYRPDSRAKTNRTVQSVVYVLALIFIFRTFEIDYELYPGAEAGKNIDFSLSNVLMAIFILLMARLISWVFIQFILSRYYRQQKVNVGSQYAINQLLMYFIYVIAILIALETLGFSLTVLWGGAAALLVGIGLGLQETFKDLFSGLILLFERTVEVGDVVEVDGLVGSVKKIGVRTSLVETRDNITVIVPNSKLIIEKVVNWSHYDNKARFKVAVGVAYGSDTELVKQILIKIARENAYVVRHPSPFVRFVNFGDSSLDFEIHFWSHEFIRIEDIMSDMRFEIDKAFRENNISIPFPQRDVWMRK